MEKILLLVNYLMEERMFGKCNASIEKTTMKEVKKREKARGSCLYFPVLPGIRIVVNTFIEYRIGHKKANVRTQTNVRARWALSRIVNKFDNAEEWLLLCNVDEETVVSFQRKYMVQMTFHFSHFPCQMKAMPVLIKTRFHPNI